MEEKAAVREYAPYEVVPPEGRYIGYGSFAMTWAGAALQPTVWTLGGTLVCCGFISGSLVLVLATIAAGLVIGSIGLIGHKTGLSSSGLLRCVLGIKASKISSVAALINSCGWIAIGNYVAAVSMSYVFEQLCGMPSYGQPGSAGTMILSVAILCVLSYLAIYFGGARFLVKMETIMMALLIVFSVIITFVLFRNITVSDILSFRVPAEYALDFPTAFNMMFVVTVTYATLMCDYSRYVKSPVTAMTAQITGGFFSSYWFCAIGMVGPIVAYMATGIFDMNNANPAVTCMSLGLGLPLLFIIVFSVVTTDMIDFYGSGNNLQNLFPKLSYKTAITVMMVIFFLISLIPVLAASFYDVLYLFLDILGVIFPPLYSIILVDFFVIRKQHYKTEDVDNEEGVYQYSKGFNVYAIIAWIIGAAVYILCTTLNLMSGSIGPAITAMLITAVIYWIIGTIAKRKGYYVD